MQCLTARKLALQRLLCRLLALRRIDTDSGLSPDDFQLGLQGLDTTLTVFDLGGRRVMADSHPRARGVQKADRLIRQLTVRDIPM